jgi:polysaccharide chain length determinant protein (PEP-CTERM system associated)
VEDQFNLSTFISSLRRRWWMPILGLLLGAAGATVMSHRLPKVYRASTLILVEPQKIPTAYVRPTVTTTIETRLRSLRQQITSRSRVERVIRELNLFPTELDVVPLEFLVGRVASKIMLTIRGGNTFRISYEGRDSKEVARVANKLAALVIEENTAARQKEAQSTSRFLDRELVRVKAQLEEEENAIAQFKRVHTGELPEQRDTNLRTLESLQHRLRTVSETLGRAKDRRLLLEAQLAELPPSGASASQMVVQLEQARTRLQELQAKFTDRHPDVLVQKREIERLEALLRKDPEEQEESAAEFPGAASGVSLYANRLRTDIRAVEVEIKGLGNEEAQIRKDIVRYRRRVENTPRNEAALSTLTRDYRNLAENYQSLLNKKLEANLAEKLEYELRGEQFNIVDRAIPPSVPHRPNLNQIVSFGSALGLLLGCAAAISLDLFRPRFRSEEELAGAFNIPVLAAIPLLVTEEGRLRAQRIRRVILGCGVAVASLGALLIALLAAGG